MDETVKHMKAIGLGYRDPHKGTTSIWIVYNSDIQINLCDSRTPCINITPTPSSSHIGKRCTVVLKIIIYFTVKKTISEGCLGGLFICPSHN